MSEGRIMGYSKGKCSASHGLRGARKDALIEEPVESHRRASLTSLCVRPCLKWRAAISNSNL